MFLFDATETKAERCDRILGELSELGLTLARDLHARALAAETEAQATDLALAFHRISRSLRQTLALEAKIERDRLAAAKDAPCAVVAETEAEAPFDPEAARRADFEDIPPGDPDPPTQGRHGPLRRTPADGLCATHAAAGPLSHRQRRLDHRPAARSRLALPSRPLGANALGPNLPHNRPNHV